MVPTEPMLRALLTPGGHPQAVSDLRIVGEIANLPWHVRVHERGMVAYDVHSIAVKRADSAPAGLPGRDRKMFSSPVLAEELLHLPDKPAGVAKD